MQSIPTLITGPSGTGKELVAQAISYSCYIPFNEKTNNFESDYLEGFYTLNLSTLSPTLIESELFGHKKGAFTGALEEHRGYFDNCGSTGAVFLDEIGEIDPQTQVKLLNLLQTRQFKRVGDTNPLYFEGKILAATNRNLALEMEEGNFREDFYYRLCADQIRTPSLYEQLEDSPGELDNLVKFLSKKVAGPENSVALSKETLEFIRKDMPKNYSWPGNIRELEQCIRSVMVNGEYIPSVKIKSEKNFKHNFYAGDITAKELIRQYAALVYKDCGSYSETARRLDVDYRTVKSYL